MYLHPVTPCVTGFFFYKFVNPNKLWYKKYILYFGSFMASKRKIFTLIVIVKLCLILVISTFYISSQLSKNNNPKESGKGIMLENL